MSENISTKICRCCGKEFIPKHPNNVYCEECLHPIVKCKGCGKLFELTGSKAARYRKSKGKKESYCTRECYKKHYKPTTFGERICKNCNKTFEAKGHKQKYCDDCLNVTVNCKECGKPIKLQPGQVHRYLESDGKETFYCSYECMYKSDELSRKKSDTYYKRSGYTHPSKNPEVKEQKKKTCLKNHKVEYNYFIPGHAEKMIAASMTPEARKKIVETNLERYNCEYATETKNMQEKARQTKKEKYGDEYYSNRKKYKRTCLERYNVEHPSQIPEVKKKVRESSAKTRRKNHGMSQEESLFIDELEKIGLVEGKDYIREYSADEYPFNCDFYFPKRKLWVELNIHWTHGYHWFNKRTKRDKDTLDLWANRVKEKHDYYFEAINTWTKRDVNKRKVARKNKLNYVTIWDKSDINAWFELGMPDGKDWEKEYSWKK